MVDQVVLNDLKARLEGRDNTGRGCRETGTVGLGDSCDEERHLGGSTVLMAEDTSRSTERLQTGQDQSSAVGAPGLFDPHSSTRETNEPAIAADEPCEDDWLSWARPLLLLVDRH